MQRYMFNYVGCDCKSLPAGITVYPNNTAVTRVIMADEYDFRYSMLMVFGGDGLLYELGSDLLANKDGTFGSPQTSVKVPAGGFLVAFGSKASDDIQRCYRIATEGAMLYNATRIATFEMFGAVDQINKTLTVYFDIPAPCSEDAKKYLFVGNSNTYFQGTPLLFRNMCRAAGIEADVDYCTFGSAYLSEFANPEHERGQALRKALKSKEYDYVILQDASKASLEDSRNSLSVILPLIENNGATPVLYMRYSSISDEGMYEQTKCHRDIYTALADEFGIDCIPSALTFTECRDKYPAIKLYADDNSHHSPEAAYMIACTWFNYFTGKSPVGNAFDPHFAPEVTHALQKTALKVCKNGYKSRKPISKAVKLAGIGLAVAGIAAIIAAVAAISDKNKTE